MHAQVGKISIVRDWWVWIYEEGVIWLLYNLNLLFLFVLKAKIIK